MDGDGNFDGLSAMGFTTLHTFEEVSCDAATWATPRAGPQSGWSSWGWESAREAVDDVSTEGNGLVRRWCSI